jgi:hypothetical protein
MRKSFVTQIRLSNVGHTANMESVTVAISDPAFCFFDDFDINTRSTVVQQEVASGTVCSASDAAAADLAQNHTVATLIAGEAQGSRHRLAPTQYAEFAVWLYGAAKAGQHTIGLLFYYDADPSHPSSNYRLFRYTICIDIQPCVDISVVAVASKPTVRPRARIYQSVGIAFHFVLLLTCRLSLILWRSGQ